VLQFYVNGATSARFRGTRKSVSGKSIQEASRNEQEMGTKRLPATSKKESRQFRADQHSIVKRTTNMIKRTKSNKIATLKGLSRAEHASLNERPLALNTAPHDPDSETAWMAEGNCRLHPPATFFPSDGVGVDRARKICKECPVVGQCLEYALDSRIDHGVWGACSERERRRILKRRREDALVDVNA
jgi:WhiB family redox-sensing transcriptional regulator